MTLMKDLSLFGVEPQELNPYEKYFLLENPFPGHGETSSDVCTDQDDLKNKFVYSLQNFSSDAKRLRINGESGAGKTNILRYFERLTDEARRDKLIENIHPIYVFAPGESYYDIHGQIIDKLSELFLGDLFEQLKSNPKRIDTLSEDIRPASELLAVIKTLVEPNSLFTIYSERHKDALIRWLKVQKLSAADKKLLTRIGEKPISDITSLSLAMRFLSGLLAVLKELGLCDGIVLLFDEFEEIFEGLSRPRQSRYAQDLRHLFDTLKESVFFVVATVPEPKDLAQYPAIERRLGNAAALQPINSLELAVEYVLNYLDDGRDKYERYLKKREAFQTPAMIRSAWKEHRDKYEHHPKGSEEHENQPQQDRPKHLEPLKPQIVEEEYGLLKKEVEEAELDILPGYFLPRMKERIKRKVELPNEQK